MTSCTRNSKLTDPVPLQKYTIESLKIEGISEQNIKIDQTKKEITILIPTHVNKVTLPANYTLGCTGCSLTNGYDGTTQISLCNPITEWTVAQNGIGQSASYRIIWQPFGDLAVSPAFTPIEYTAKDSHIILPVLNYYDGEPASEITFRNESTGATTTINEVLCYGDSANQLMIGLNANLPLGKYTFALAKKNGRQLKFPQSLLVKKDIPEFWIYQYLLVNTPKVALSGYNLYSNDNIEVLITNRKGYEAKLKPFDYKDNGTSMTISLPTDLKADYYTVQTIQNGQPLPVAPYGNIMIVADNEKQPFVYTISSGAGTLNRSITMQRGKMYPMSLSYNGNTDTNVSLRLVNTENPADEFIAPVTVPGGYFWSMTEGSGVSVTIPNDTKPGRYQVYPRFQDGSTIRDGLLYGWEVEIQ